MGSEFCYPAFPGGRQKVFTMSYDDGNDCDRPLVEMMRRHGVKGTFNVNSGLMPDEPLPHDENHRWRRMTMRQCLETYGSDMEMAIHGVTHPWWARLPKDAALQDILEDRRALERGSGRLIRGGAHPEGSTGDDVAEMLRLAGLSYCRGGKRTRDLTALPKDYYRLRPTTVHSDPKLMELARKFVGPKKQPVLWMLFVSGHSFEFVRDGNWDVMEELLSLVGGREDIWYATNLEMVDYLRALRALQYSVDQTEVRNPTAAEVWLLRGGMPICIPAGASVRF